MHPASVCDFSPCSTRPSAADAYTTCMQQQSCGMHASKLHVAAGLAWHARCAPQGGHVQGVSVNGDMPDCSPRLAGSMPASAPGNHAAGAQVACLHGGTDDLLLASTSGWAEWMLKPGGGAVQVTATCKHFAAYSLEAADGFTRNSFNAQVDARCADLASIYSLLEL